ncbi:MAG: 4Fe-4S binding protein, partial [Microvirga sp.]
MNAPLKKQHLIDPEICIRCNTCEETCPIDAVTHDDNNYVVDAAICNYCMDCIAPCPTGAIDNWRIVARPYTNAEQFSWGELPVQEEMPEGEAAGAAIEALEDEVGALLEEARKGL